MPRGYHGCRHGAHLGMQRAAPVRAARTSARLFPELLLSTLTLCVTIRCLGSSPSSDKYVKVQGPQEPDGNLGAKVPDLTQLVNERDVGSKLLSQELQIQLVREGAEGKSLMIP